MRTLTLGIVVVGLAVGAWAYPAVAQTPAAESCVVAVDGGTTYTGTGHDVLDIGRLEAGVYLVAIAIEEPSYQIVEMTGRSTGDWTVLSFDAPGFRDVWRISESNADDYLMEVDAEGEWTITIAPA